MRFQINHKFNPGDNVRIDAYTDDGQHAWVEETVPQPPLPIENVDTASVLKNFQSSYYTEFLRFDITIKDKPEEKNYYRLILERRQRYLAPTYDEHFNYIADSIIYAKKYKIYNYEDMILTDGFPIIGGSIDELEERPENIYNVFNDNSFNGSSATLRIYKDIDYYSGDLLDYECYVRIQSIDERTFMNYKILNLIDSEVFDYGYPEAIIVDSNVNGGTGLVSFSSETSVYMKLR